MSFTHLCTCQAFIYQEKWKQLTAEERLSFYENGELPPGKLDELFRRNHMNFNLDWKLLWPALEKAMAAIRSSQPIVSVQQPLMSHASPV